MKLRALLLCAALSAAASVVHAYAPTPAFIMDLVAGKRVKHKLTALRVTVKRTEYTDAKPSDPVDVTITWREGGRVREEWTGPDGIKHARVMDGGKMLLVDGDKKASGTPTPDLMNALFPTGATPEERHGARERAVAVLQAWGINDNVVSFARADGRIAWVVGAPPRTLDVPQVWVDKDDLVLLRSLRPVSGFAPPVPDGGVAEKVPLSDERYREWGSAIGGEFFPGRIEVYRDGVLVRTDELVKIDVTPKIDERDFKVD